MCEQQHVTSFSSAASDAMLRQCQQEQVPETASDEIQSECSCTEELLQCMCRCIGEMMRSCKHDNFEMMVASHNQASVEAAVALMHDLGMHPTESGVHFGQLLGMADHLTYTLGGNGYQAYKAVPYGPVEETIAYLLRRAKENSDMLGSVGKETAMLRSELWRRIKCNNPVSQFFSKQPAEAMLAGTV